MDIGKKIKKTDLCPSDLLTLQEKAYLKDIENLKKQKKFFVEVNCPACKADNKKNIFEKYSFKFQICKNCETIFMSPRPTQKIMDSYYQNSENYKFWAENIFPKSESIRKNSIHKLWIRRIISYIKKYNLSHKSIIEVGSGYGTFGDLTITSKFFREYVGIEPTPELSKVCRNRNLKIINKKVEDVNLNKKFDVAVSFEVIEHIFNPELFLQKIGTFLKKKGCLFLSCPNGKGFDIEILREQSQSVDSEHVNLFNPNSIELLLNTNNFDVLEIFTPGRLDAEIVRDEILKGFTQIDSFLKKILVEDWERIGWKFQKFLAKNNLSSHMWVCAQKR